MDGVRATVNGKKLVFASSGDLADTTGAAEAVNGRWTAASARSRRRER